eukprot:TRINITY_DN6560_c0_g1_i1.p1 TRINITY_DN6560_c0_g1~~TRINITY_DN6560_c0_g1_i1.p1  ORF type:complete len:233 (+),score=20.80 TRINITY_DN6560_c0_g1_i1:129-827(+)
MQASFSDGRRKMKASEDMNTFQDFIRRKYLFLKRYRESLSVLVTGSLLVSIGLSLVQVASSLFSRWQYLAEVAGASIPWTLSFFALACGWWGLLPPLDPNQYVERLNHGMRFLNLKFDVDQLCISRISSTQHSSSNQPPGSPPSISPPTSPTVWKLGVGLEPFDTQAQWSVSPSSRPKTPPPSPISNGSTPPGHSPLGSIFNDDSRSVSPSRMGAAASSISGSIPIKRNRFC